MAIPWTSNMPFLFSSLPCRLLRPSFLFLSIHADVSWAIAAGNDAIAGRVGRGGLGLAALSHVKVVIRDTCRARSQKARYNTPACKRAFSKRNSSRRVPQQGRRDPLGGQLRAWTYGKKGSGFSDAPTETAEHCRIKGGPA